MRIVSRGRPGTSNHKYGRLAAVRTTIDIPDPTYRKLKSKAAAQGRSVKDLILHSVEQEFSGETRRGKRIKLPIVRSKEPGALHLTNEEIYDIIPFP